MTTHWDPKSPSLQLTIVCYADILGFRAMTECALESGKEMDFLRRIKRSLDEAYDIVRKAKTLDGAVPSIFDMKVFTDNIVVAYPLRDLNRDLWEPELDTLLMVFAEVQARLASDGYFLRGAIALGNHYQDDDIVYGKALLEAYDLDRSGGPPRLVIGPSVEPLIARQLSSYGDKSWAPQYKQLLEDPSDERLFVNYLEVAFKDFPDGPLDDQLLATHSENVRRALTAYESDSRVRAKYEWMAMYHNYVCRAFADRYSIQGDRGANPERMAVRAEAQRALEHLVPSEGLPSEHAPRPLKAQRLRQRLAAQG